MYIYYNFVLCIYLSICGGPETESTCKSYAKNITKVVDFNQNQYKLRDPKDSGATDMITKWNFLLVNKDI